ncbi:hypothetical protein AALP_AA2G081300 [Arabis alpina]|uniref:RING-type E3 ubiquitin transferase n=1 Tax=Arabis alpina TaxID=50452 RepID=A0A087HG15_ARAAL|nr:hypothetical protein AALP_AA2G081300 [Arabis alpina]
MTSAELAITEEASSSRKRIRLSIGEKGVTVSANRNRDGSEVITMEIPRNLLECPVCFHALTIPTFQCDNRHIACSSCCTKLSNKCPTCKVPTGKIRCRFAESIVEANIVPCPNAILGCTEKFPYGKELAHEEKCAFALCYCPEPNCNYTGKYQDLYSHYYANHQRKWDYFYCGTSRTTFLYNSMKNEVIQEYREGPLVVVQYFKVEQGVHVTVNCIAPCASGVGKFSYHISYSRGHHTNAFGPVEMNRIQKLSLQTPQKGSCMIVPDCFLDEGLLEIHICIRRLVEEEEAAEGVEEPDEETDEESEEEESGESGESGEDDD